MAKFRLKYAYLRVVKEKSVNKFTTRDQAFDFLSNEIFFLEEFDFHIEEVAQKQSIPYDLAYEIITNYLTDVLYEIDKAQALPKRKTRITIPGYLEFNVGQAAAFKTRAFTLLKLFKGLLSKKRN